MYNRSQQTQANKKRRDFLGKYISDTKSVIMIHHNRILGNNINKKAAAPTRLLF